jgi:class 3 adenylate cyclase
MLMVVVLVVVGAVTFEGVLLSAVGDTGLSVFAVGVGVADAQAVRAIRLMTRTMLKMFFRFIHFLHG